MSVIRSRAPNEVAQRIIAAAGQTADLLRVETSDGVMLFAVDKDGGARVDVYALDFDSSDHCIARNCQLVGKPGTNAGTAIAMVGSSYRCVIDSCHITDWNSINCDINALGNDRDSVIRDSYIRNVRTIDRAPHLLENCVLEDVFYLRAYDGCTVRGCTFRQVDVVNSNWLLQLTGARQSVERCRFFGYHGYGIKGEGSSDLLVRDCWFDGGSYMSIGWVQLGTRTRIEGCVVEDDATAGTYGLINTGSGEPSLINNVVGASLTNSAPAVCRVNLGNIGPGFGGS